MCKMLGLKVRVMATKAMVIRTMVVVMVVVMGRSAVGPMLWIPLSNRGNCLVSLKGDQLEPFGYHVHWADKA